MAYPKGKPKSEASKLKARLAMQKHYEDPANRAAQAKSFAGRTHSEETKRKMAEARIKFWTPEKRAALSQKIRRGRQISSDHPEYNSLHKWMAYHHDKSGACSICEKSGYTVWAMRRPPFAERDLKDWVELCPSCHKFYDSRRITWAN